MINVEDHAAHCRRVAREKIIRSITWIILLLISIKKIIKSPLKFPTTTAWTRPTGTPLPQRIFWLSASKATTTNCGATWGLARAAGRWCRGYRVIPSAPLKLRSSTLPVWSFPVNFLQFYAPAIFWELISKAEKRRSAWFRSRGAIYN